MDVIKIIFEVKSIIYRNIEDGYSIVSVNLKEHPEDVKIPTADHIVAGHFLAVHVKDEFEAEGSWVDTGPNGYRFNMVSSNLIFPETSKGIINFLVRFVDGVGNIIARRIVEKFKEETFDIIINDYEKLLQIKGMSERKAVNIHNAIKIHKSYEKLVCFFIPLGLSYNEIVLIYDKLGEDSIEKVTDNPYILYNYDVNFLKMDGMAKKFNKKSNNPERIKSGILLYIDNQVKSRGNMFVYKNELIKGLPSFLERVGCYGGDNYSIEEGEIEEALEELITLNKIKIDKSSKGDCIYISFYKYIEDKIIEEVLSIKNTAINNFINRNDIRKFIKKYEFKTRMRFAEGQKKAIYMALGNKLSILSGGPGTGKTQTINSIISCIKELRPESSIELCAPTGKAAKRMTELTGMEARTIHRMLGIKGFSEEPLEIEDVDADYVIMDEASMVDAYIFYCFLSSISEHTKILIVGDYEQLPSVGAGLILRDLIQSETVPTTILNEIFRQAKDSQIVMNSHKVIKGIKTGDENGITFDKDKGDFYFINIKEKERIGNIILRSIDRLLETGFKFDDIQVLSSMNRGDLGVRELNRRIQERFNPKKNGLNEVQIGNYRYLRVNDRVMQTVNNYELEVFNGEVGNITSIIMNNNGIEVAVDYGDKDVVYDAESVSELILAYAVTVHKFQGSEIPVVIMPFHSSLSVLLSRNIIYTAWTRAKERVICVGDIDELNKGISRTNNIVRNSQIKDKLIQSQKKIKNAV